MSDELAVELRPKPDLFEVYVSGKCIGRLDCLTIDFGKPTKLGIPLVPNIPFSLRLDMSISKAAFKNQETMNRIVTYLKGKSKNIIVNVVD